MLSSRLLARVERRIQETQLPLAVRLWDGTRLGSTGSAAASATGNPLANGALELPATRDHIYAR